METLISLLACYGFAFFVQNKMWQPEDPPWPIDKLLSCVYCLGFWSGLALYLIRAAVFMEADPTPLQHLFNGLVFGFASSVFCYALDTAVQWLEETRGQ